MVVSYYYTVRSDDVKVLKSRWNFVKTKTTTPGNNIYTLLITFIAFTSFISSKFQTLFFPYKLSYYATTGPYYAWATCGITFYRLTNEITDGINQSDKSLLCCKERRRNGIFHFGLPKNGRRKKLCRDYKTKRKIKQRHRRGEAADGYQALWKNALHFQQNTWRKLQRKLEPATRITD